MGSFGDFFAGLFVGGVYVVYITLLYLPSGYNSSSASTLLYLLTDALNDF